jgi:hypothetical protein
MRITRFVPFVLVLVLLVAPACASSGSGGSGGSGGGPNLITRAELDQNPTLSAYDAIQRLRGGWLQGRSNQEPVVLMDGAPMGGLAFLRSIQASQLEDIRRMSATDATTRYGTGYGGGTIELRGRRGM